METPRRPGVPETQGMEQVQADSWDVWFHIVVSTRVLAC
jgi:hypothetical protein